MSELNIGMDITVAEANAYHILRGNEDWQFFGTDAEKLAALYRASDFIRRKYRLIAGDLSGALAREATIMLAPLIDKLAARLTAASIESQKESLEGVGSTETKFRVSEDPFPEISDLLAPVSTQSNGSGGLTMMRIVR
jgi:hypothetical protein